MELESILSEFEGKKCWKAGQSYGTMFLLETGKKVRDEVSKRNRGAYHALILTSDWEIFKDGKSIAFPTSPDREKINKDLKILVGKKIREVIFRSKKRQIDIRFEEKVVLSVGEDEDMRNSEEEDDCLILYTPTHIASFGKDGKTKISRIIKPNV